MFRLTEDERHALERVDLSNGGAAGFFEDDLLPSIRETWGSMISIRSLARPSSLASAAAVVWPVSLG